MIKEVLPSAEKMIIPAPMLMPKLVYQEEKQPPSCPLKDIEFIQLERFKRFKNVQVQTMGEGFDQIGKKNMMRINREKRKDYEEEKK